MSKHLAEESADNKHREMKEGNRCRIYGRSEPLPGMGKHRAGRRQAA